MNPANTPPKLMPINSSFTLSAYARATPGPKDWGSKPVWQDQPNYHHGPGWEPARLGANDHRRWPSRGLV